MEWIQMTSQCPIMAGVPVEELLKLFEHLQFQIKSYKKDDLMMMQGEEVKRLMILLQGSARGEMTDSDGKVVKIEDIMAPRPLAGAFLFGKENRSPVDVIANEPVKALIIYRDEFLKLLRMNEIIMMNYLSIISSRAQFLSRKIKMLAFKTIRGKITSYLISLGARQGETIEIPISQRELADLFGVARPSIARGLGDMEKDGLIEVRNRKVTILNLLSAAIINPGST